MDDVIEFALLGFGLGALYALSAQGLIVIYRGSGVLNFAQGAMGMVGAYVFFELRVNHGVPFALALAAGIAVSAIAGLLTYLVVMRPLRRASPLARVVGTLGVLIILQGIATIRYGTNPLAVPSDLPTTLVHVGSIVVTADRFILLAIAVVIGLALWAAYRFTPFGVATSAVAESERSASTVGLSPRKIAAANWAIGSALAGMAAILVAPIVSLSPDQMTTLVLAGLGVALVAGFRSFPIALIAGLILGIVQTEMDLYVTTPGVADSVPFIFVVLVVVFTGRSVPLRDFFLQRLPRVGTGQVRVSPVLAGVAIASVFVLLVPGAWQDATITTFATGITFLSIVVLTGYAGQISLAQVAIGGVGALVAGRLAATGWPFLAALVAGVAATIPVGVLCGLPAVRSRGINLAVVTLGLGTAIEMIVFNNPSLATVTGVTIPTPHIFGWNIDPILHTDRYAFVVIAAFTLVALAVANLRRGRVGRRLLAVRENERAAAALGIRVTAVKVYVFTLASAIAGVGGVLTAFHFFDVVYSTQFMNINSINDTAFAFLGGIGYVMGAFVGSTFSPGTLGTQVGDVLFSGIGEWVSVIGGVILIVILLTNQDGAVSDMIKQNVAIARRVGLTRLTSRLPFATRMADDPRELSEAHTEVRARTVEVKRLTVRYGSVVAVADVSLTLRPRQVLGLIGPNGAGKTTLIDAVTGFARPSSGSVFLDNLDITKWSTTRRARGGISRSFQGLELFESMTVIDNIRVAADPRDGVSYVRDLVWPKLPRLPGAAVAAIREFGLAEDVGRSVEDLPYGRRRLVAIARAVASLPSVLLLDEPTAGLTEVETRELVHLVRSLAEKWGMAVLLVEHDVNFIMNTCDEIVVLNFGKKISDGRPEIVRADPGVIEAYLGSSDSVLDESPAASAVGAGQ